MSGAPRGDPRPRHRTYSAARRRASSADSTSWPQSGYPSLFDVAAAGVSAWADPPLQTFAMSWEVTDVRFKRAGADAQVRWQSGDLRGLGPRPHYDGDDGQHQLRRARRLLRAPGKEGQVTKVIFDMSMSLDGFV